jgi:phosphoesterase RecJ-like protein
MKSRMKGIKTFSMDKTLLDTICRLFHESRKILILSHTRPDGDAIGSLLGLGLSFQDAGKAVSMVLPEGAPAIFQHLEGSAQVRSRSQPDPVSGPEEDFDLVVTVDCSDRQRLGNALEVTTQPDINIDHHPTNTNFARYNWVDPKAVATAEMLSELLEYCQMPLTRQVADALLFGIITDTLGFRTQNMTPQALRIAADLMEAGGNLPDLYSRGLLSRSYEAARYWGAGLTGLNRAGRLIWTSLTQKARQAVGYRGRDDADLISVLSTVEDSDVAVVFTEQANGNVKVSWRSQPGYDVSQVALRFGGGGHAAAAGAEIEGDLEEVQTRVLETTRNLLGLSKNNDQ